MKRSLLVCAVLFLLCANFVYAQEKKTVAGIVQDEKGGPLVGVSVQEKAGSAGTLTDANGAFKLSISTEATLVFTYIGYVKQEIPLNGRVSLAIRLAPDSKGLNEVVVTAMGIKKERRKLGYAVSNISGEELVKSSPTNFASAMYGKAAGVSIQTAPGGSTSAAIIKIRGVNSINGDGQPLIVVDGVPIRNDIVNTGDANKYWGDTRIRGNSLLDINPDNIKEVNILKGSAATALYGSSGSNGVVMITTKQGNRRAGMGVDFNYSYGMEQAAVLPDIQSTYGPGYDRKNQVGSGYPADGWIPLGDINGDGKEDVRVPYDVDAQFGPKFDGRDVVYVDGSTRKYVGTSDNWKKLFKNGYSSQANIALSNANDRGSYRFSYNRIDYKGIQIGGKQQKNNFNLNTSYKITPRLSTDVTVTYVNEYVHNRPEQMNRVLASYAGFFSAFDDMDFFLKKYQTTKGYKYVTLDNSSRDPEEAFKYPFYATDFLDFLWKQKRNSYDEKSNRFISSFTLNYDIATGLKFRGRMGTDITGYTSETKNYAEYPLYVSESGAYSVANNQYNIAYGDLLLTYNKDFSPKFGLNASLGYQARREERRYSGMSTAGGLLQENWFTIQASKNPVTGQNDTKRTSYLQDGIFGIVGLSYRNFLFLEGTGRYERVSVLAPGNNSYFYPSVSLSFEMSKALHMPNFVDYSKLRLSYGVAANPPGIYQANIVYTGSSANGAATLYPGSNYGNNGLKPEFKHEYEIGWESKMFENRLGFDISYYNNIVKGQIINLNVASSTGAKNIWQNVGDLNNYGLEAAIYATPISSKNLTWDVRANVGFNRNKLKSLQPGLTQLQLMNVDNGSAYIVAKVGEAAGDIMVNMNKKSADGQNIIDANGYYVTDNSAPKKAGNIQAKLNGGIGNTIRYKNWTLDFLVDSRWGGQILSVTNYYATGDGLYKSTLKYRDEASGGLTYYEDAAGNRTLLNGGSAPAGTTVYHDGVILDGVDETGKKNDKILQAAQYYEYTYGWGNYGARTKNSYQSAVFDNNFVKLREASLNYSFPVALANKAKMQTLTVGLFGRNLFYFYKTLPNVDPEVGIGSNFISQGLDAGSSVASRTIGGTVRLSF
ncbi:iron complex outermembrane recepter protein [Chitinophaga rupis]|uniref:Iron complex outermembrane recepter protein n=1 Tax=Chitinophaga rupis TaxID=573321 RepID=A0A1H7WIW6_9BACT|nr:SusC/RagA family TonB-linked outer membrane protein [Chitinophaga rupis]SEM20837.1 iron complex outermembrane recepter protein [Chitinophaga rupis]